MTDTTNADYYCAIAGLLGLRAHREDCPVEDDLDTRRVEAYDQVRPPNHATAPNEPVATVRCMECGGLRHRPGETVAQAVDRVRAAS